jgi:hypothetical protein
MIMSGDRPRAPLRSLHGENQAKRAAGMRRHSQYTSSHQELHPRGVNELRLSRATNIERSWSPPVV